MGGKNSYGRPVDFYSEPVLRNLCADLLVPMPHAGPDCFIEIDGVRFGAIAALSRSLDISESAVKSKILSSGIASVAGKDLNGRPTRFYPEPAVRELFAPPLEADATGILEVKGVRHCTVPALARSLNVNNTTVYARLKGSGIVPIRGKCKEKPVYLYPEPVARELCKDLLDLSSKMGETGFMEIEGVRHGTVKALAHSFRVGENTIRRRLHDSGISAVRGKNNRGNVCDLYPELGVRKLCADLLALLPVADEAGFIISNGVRHGTLRAFVRSMGISIPAIKPRLKNSAVVTIQGKDKNGHVLEFYPEPQVRELCADLLAQLPVADKSGYIEVSSIRHGCVKALSQTLGVSCPTIFSKIRRSGVAPVIGKLRGGQPCDFYPELRVRELCADLLAPLPMADSFGFVLAEGVRHGTIYALSNSMGVDYWMIEKCLKKVKIIAIRGKGRAGSVLDFYPEPAVRELYKDFLEKKAKKSNPKPR